MNEKKKHKIMLGIEVILLCMIVAILGTNAASSNPPSNGVSYNKNSQTTVEGALNDLYTKANYGNATASQILKDKTALVGGKKVTGTMEDRGLAQYGSWGCGDLGCGSGDDAYYSINSLPEGYYHSDGNTWAPEARINANTLRTSLGITADKILKGQSIAGVNGTGETSCPSCSCPEWKVYSVHQKQATVTESYKTYNGSLVDMIGDGKHSKFEIDLGFTPSQVGDLYVKMFSHVSNYFQISSSIGNWQMDFLYCHTAPSVNGVQRFHNSSTNNSINVSCNVLGSKVILDVWGDSKIKTNASTFLMDVLLRYK